MTGVIGLDHLQLAMPRGREADARAFYGGILGLPELQKPPNLAVRGGVWFALGPQQLHLGVEEEFRPARKAHPALVGAAIFVVCARGWNRHGFKPYDDEPLAGYERFYVADPFGNRLRTSGAGRGVVIATLPSVSCQAARWPSCIPCPPNCFLVRTRASRWR